MHSMHQLRVSNETSSHLQQSQGLAHETNSAAISPERRANMTVLVKPDGAQATGQVANQPILSVLEPVQQQQQPMSDQAMRPVTTNLQAPPVSHHLMQQQQQQQPQPHLHLLGAPRSQHEQDQLEQQSMSQQHEQQEGQQQPARSNSASGRQRQQIEGIMGDGGGPIVQWLVENYEIAEGESLPRSTVYNHYINHCRRLCLASVNAASFGKMIRSVFVGLKTRRLGTRGHSKYHYFGIRAKRTRLEWTQESDQMGPQDGQRRGVGCSSMMGDANQDNSNTDQGSESDSTGDCHDGRLSSLGGGSVSNNATNSSLKRLKRFHDAEMNDPGELGAYGEPIEQHGNHFDGVGEANQHYASSGAYYSTGYAIRQEGGCSLDQCDLTSLRQHLGANSATLVDEHWPQVEAGSIERQLADRLQGSSDCGTDPTSEDLPSLVQAFEGQYKLHYKRLIDLLGVFQFNEVEHLCSEFWHPSPPPAAHETVHQWASSEASTNGNEHEHEHHHHHHHHHHQHQHQRQHQHHHLHQAMDADQQLAQQQQQALVYGHHNQDQQMLAMSPSTNLTFNQLYQLTSQPEMIERINQIDRKLYSAIERFLMPDMLGPAPRPLIQHIRIFCRDISAWMEAAIKDYTGAFVAEKLKSIRALEHTLRRRSSINHLSTCARSVWNKRSALAQMSLDLSRIDLRDIEHQVSLMSRTKVDLLESGQQNQSELFRTANELITQQDQQRSPIIIEHDNPGQRQQHRNEVIQSDSGISGANKMDAQISHQSNGNIVNNYLNNNGNTTQTNRFSLCRDSFDLMQPAHLIQNFLHLLEDPYPANIWPDWCRSLVESRVCGQSFEEARNFILKWSFHVSLILRELTLRSAPSLGSFQLIRLLFDEYMYHLVVVRLAQAQHKTPIQMLTTSIKFDNIQ